MSDRKDVGMDPNDKKAQREMWDGWWYDRFEIPHAVPADARRLELEMGARALAPFCSTIWRPRPARPSGSFCPIAAT